MHVSFANFQAANGIPSYGPMQIRSSSIVMSVSVAKIQLMISTEIVVAQKYLGNCEIICSQAYLHKCEA